MKTETFGGTIETAHGTKLDIPIKFTGSFEAYENLDEVRSANDFPNDESILDFVNNKRKANARQQSMTASLEAAGIVKPTLETDENLQLQQMVKVYMARGKSREVAEKLAAAALSA